MERAPKRKLYHFDPKQVRPMLKNETESYGITKKRNKQYQIATTTEEVCHKLKESLVEGWANKSIEE